MGRIQKLGFTIVMRRKAVDRSWSKHNIPMEIWWEILVRLPVRCLVRFRCVSRLWKGLIEDPDFCREHLVQFKNNRDETHLLMVEGSGFGVQNCLLRCSDTMKTSGKLGCLGVWNKKTRNYESSATPGFNGYWKIWFSVDGLFMLRSGFYHSKLVLWNPSIRKCQLVQHSFDTTKLLELGLGFDPLIKDYKLVRVSRCSAGWVEIYTVGTASWRTVKAQGTATSSWLPTACERESVYFKGCLYICSGTKLVSFDLSREVFKYVDLPGKNVCESLALVDRGSSLAVLHFSKSDGGSIWVLDNNGDASSWSIRCTFVTRVPRFLHLKNNGDLLFDRMLSKLKVVSYNIYTEEEIHTKYQRKTNSIYGYKESLVLLK